VSDVRAIERTIAAVALALAALAPVLFSTYTVDQLLTQVLIFGIVAMSLIFLASYGGMVSLAQTALFGIAGFVFGNMTTVDTKGLTLGYSPWAGIIPAILIATAIGLVFGGLASRSTGMARASSAAVLPTPSASTAIRSRIRRSTTQAASPRRRRSARRSAPASISHGARSRSADARSLVCTSPGEPLRGRRR